MRDEILPTEEKPPKKFHAQRAQLTPQENRTRPGRTPQDKTRLAVSTSSAI